MQKQQYFCNLGFHLQSSIDNQKRHGLNGCYPPKLQDSDASELHLSYVIRNFEHAQSPLPCMYNILDPSQVHWMEERDDNSFFRTENFQRVLKVVI